MAQEESESMTWVKFSERWPTLSSESGILSGIASQEVIVRAPDQFEGDRRARYHHGSGNWLLSDCTHPMQNCAFSTSTAEWLED